MGRKRLDGGRESAAVVAEPASEDVVQVAGSLLRGLEILKVFRPECPVMGNGEIATAMGLPKATVSRLTRGLTGAGYLTTDPATGKYQLSPSILSLCFTVLSNMPILNVSHESMQQLANISGCAVSLAHPDGLHLIYLDRSTGEAMPYFMGIGARIEIARTAAGRAYLSALPEAARNKLMSELAAFYGREWKTLRPRIDDCIAQVRARGFCVVENDWKLNVRAVAAPVVSRGKRNILAINCAGPSYAVSLDRLVGEFGPRVTHLCQTLAMQF